PYRTTYFGDQDWVFTVPQGVNAFEFSVTVDASTNTPAPPEAVTNSAGGPGSSRVMVRTVAGNAGATGFADGVASEALFTSVRAVAADTSGDTFVADGNAIRRITATGLVSTIAGP